MNSENLNELAAALAKAQGEITGALKDSANPFFKSKYADLASCWDACRAALSKNGLAVIQAPMTEATETFLVTTLLHSSGQYMQSKLAVSPKDDTPQAMGSALTYARRYALTAMVGVAQVDDDGNAASAHPQQAYTEPHRPQGDMGKNISDEHARAAAAKAIEILGLDMDEDRKAMAVLDQHDIFNKDQELYVAAMGTLQPSQRNAWKAYIKIGQKKTAAERF